LRDVVIKIDVVHAHNLAAVDVNHLLIEQIAAEQQQSFGAVGRGPFRSRSGGPNAAIDGGNSSQGQHAVSRRRFDDQQRNPGAVLLRGKGNLAHSTTGSARGVIDGRAQQFAQGHGGHHQKNTQERGRMPDE
jgi:hypothetical protein